MKLLLVNCFDSSGRDLVSHVVPLAELSMRMETIVSRVVLASVFLQCHMGSSLVVAKIELLWFIHLLEKFEEKKGTVKEEGEY